MRAFGRTDVGRTRQSNQDAFVCGHFADSLVYAVVCDGMGGANGGNIASALATQAIVESLGAADLLHMETREQLETVIECAVSKANEAIFNEAMKNKELQGMGTTAVVVLVKDQQALIAHVGDSRAYYITNDGLYQITRDHSLVQEMVESGKITPKEAQNHPRKNFITRALGVEEQVACDFNEVILEEDTALLLCTDGLTNMVPIKNMQSIIRSCSPDLAIDRLIGAANMAGGNDNITAVLLCK